MWAWDCLPMKLHSRSTSILESYLAICPAFHMWANTCPASITKDIRKMLHLLSQVLNRLVNFDRDGLRAEFAAVQFAVWGSHWWQWEVSGTSQENCKISLSSSPITFTCTSKEASLSVTSSSLLWCLPCVSLTAQGKVKYSLHWKLTASLCVRDGTISIESESESVTFYTAMTCHQQFRSGY